MNTPSTSMTDSDTNNRLLCPSFEKFPTGLIKEIRRKTPSSDYQYKEQEEVCILYEIIRKQLANSRNLKKEIYDNILLAAKIMSTKGTEAIDNWKNADNNKPQTEKTEIIQLMQDSSLAALEMFAQLTKITVETVDKVVDLQENIQNMQLQQRLEHVEEKLDTQNIQITDTKNILENNNRILEEFKKCMKENNETYKIEENNKKLEEIKQIIEESKKQPQTRSYASVAAEPDGRRSSERTTLHSIVITSKNTLDTGEEVLEMVKNTIKAKEEGLEIEKIRKAKDRKIILSCKTKEGRKIIKEKLKDAENKINVENIENKKPLIVIKNVLETNTNEDIQKALPTQNKKIFQDLTEEDSKIQIIFRKKTRNPQVTHVVARVAPKLWQRMTDEGLIHIDLQRVKVEDQSPLIMCSMCLAYGHTKKLCTEKTPKCSHCGGPHIRTKCSEWLVNSTPKCCNCTHAKLEKIDHNAFSEHCPIRQKWENLARSTIAYN